MSFCGGNLWAIPLACHSLNAITLVRLSQSQSRNNCHCQPQHWRNHQDITTDGVHAPSWTPHSFLFTVLCNTMRCSGICLSWCLAELCSRSSNSLFFCSFKQGGDICKRWLTCTPTPSYFDIKPSGFHPFCKQKTLCLHSRFKIDRSVLYFLFSPQSINY